MTVTVRHEYRVRLVTSPPPQLVVGSIAAALADGSALLTGTHSPPGGGSLFPTAATTGLAPFEPWTPATTHPSGLTISTNGAVIEDAEITGVVTVTGDGVTMRRCRVNNGRILNTTGAVGENLLLEDTEVVWSGFDTIGSPSIGTTSFTARRCKVLGSTEIFRASDNVSTPPGPILIEDSYVVVEEPSDPTGWHGDAFQGYQNTQPVTINNSVFILNTTWGNSPLFYPGGDGNTGDITINGLIVAGGGYCAELSTANHTPSVTGLYIVENTWKFGPFLVIPASSAPAQFEAWLCTLDGNGQPVPTSPIAWS